MPINGKSYPWKAITGINYICYMIWGRLSCTSYKTFINNIFSIVLKRLDRLLRLICNVLVDKKKQNI